MTKNTNDLTTTNEKSQNSQLKSCDSQNSHEDTTSKQHFVVS